MHSIRPKVRDPRAVALVALVATAALAHAGFTLLNANSATKPQESSRAVRSQAAPPGPTPADTLPPQGTRVVRFLTAPPEPGDAPGEADLQPAPAFAGDIDAGS